MSITNPRVVASSTVIASPAAGAETIVAQVDGIATRPGGSPVLLRGYVNLIIGTGGTLVYLTLRRGTTTGGHQVFQTDGITATAGASYTHYIEAIDIPGEVAGQSYVLTVTVSNATAASTISGTALDATY